MANNKQTGTFQLDLSGGAEILQSMARDQVFKSAGAIAGRTRSMLSKMGGSGSSPEVRVDVDVTTIKRGQRAVATVSVATSHKAEREQAQAALIKSRDAGKVR